MAHDESFGRTSHGNTSKVGEGEKKYGARIFSSDLDGVKIDNRFREVHLVTHWCAAGEK